MNRTKCAKIIFYDRRRKRQLEMPPPLPNVPRVQELKVLGVTLSASLTVAEHVNSVISSSAQSVHALRLLRAHGMPNELMHIVYRAVLVAKLTYSASAWWGFTSAALGGGPQARQTMCSDDVPTSAELVDRADDELFEEVLGNPRHVLHNTLPKETVTAYISGVDGITENL